MVNFQKRWLFNNTFKNIFPDCFIFRRGGQVLTQQLTLHNLFPCLILQRTGLQGFEGTAASHLFRARQGCLLGRKRSNFLTWARLFGLLLFSFAWSCPWCPRLISSLALSSQLTLFSFKVVDLFALQLSIRVQNDLSFRWSCKLWEGEYNTYWSAGGGRGQNPCRTGLAQGLDLCLKYGTQFRMLYVPREAISP